MVKMKLIDFQINLNKKNLQEQKVLNISKSDSLAVLKK